jgi:polysaccharide biosynthesis transport protein
MSTNLPVVRGPGALPAAARARPDASSGAADLHRYADVLRNRWRLLAAVAATVVAAVVGGTLLQTPVYRASGLLELRGQSSEGVPVEALFQAGRLSSQFLGTQYGMLRSRALARRVMARVGLVTPAAAAAADPLVARRVEAFARHLAVEPVTGSNLVAVRFESSDPVLAARVVNAVFEGYAAMRVEAARAAVGSLVAEADSARRRLTTGERALQQYASENGLAYVAGARGAPGALPDERLRVLRQQLAEAEADRYAKESINELATASGEGLLESEILQSLSVRG